jgi:hypothetical protein
MTTTRSILLGGPLCLGLLLAGCPFDEPPVIGEDSESTETVGATTQGATTMPTTTMPTTVEPTTTEPVSEATTVDPTTMGSVDDTTVGVTTMEVSATESSGSSESTGDPCVASCDGVACGSIDACECGECGPMATCADDQTYCGVPLGFYNDFGSTPSVTPQFQIGHRFQVFEDTVVRRLGLISGGAGATVRLALYDHDGVGPANRLVQTGAVMLYANGNNEYDVGATPIVPGDYWVMVHTEGNTPIRSTFNGDNMYEAAWRTSIPFAAGFPVALNDETVGLDYRYNLYMIVED